ncbi:hypothetical protein MMC27_006651 [Xylographa pallens]|nr:hypothetical protein [Xylographa pallens]
MVDPFTALSLAGTVVQFVDYGSKLIKEGSELYHSAGGALPVNAELEKITVNLKEITKKLESSARTDTGSTGDTKETGALRSLAESCSEAADELLNVLEDLKVKGTNRQWQSLRQALRSSHKKDEIRKIEKKLDKLQQMLNTRLIAMMSDQQSSVISLLESLDEGNISRMTQLKTDIIDLVQRSRNAKHDTSEEDSSGLLNCLTSVIQEGKTSELNRSVLTSLCFQSMTVRLSNIAEAHAKTFEWIFEDGNHQVAEMDSHPTTRFVEWLTSKNGVYWICGKAGSGKSTLMKYLAENDRTMSALKLWAGSDRLITASYFFWNAGVSMQKSQQGLLQSLLHEVLGRCQNLIPLVCAQRLKRIEDLRYSHEEPWSRSDLSMAFQQLIHHELVATKFCFFVDGLDEYDGDHEDIIHILKRFTKSPRIKICTSSRPWNIFIDTFGQTLERKLLLEDLTREDIRCYVKDQLDEYEKFVHLKVIDSRYNVLVKEIVDKAQGVFLWVFLVVRSLRKGLKEADDISDLQRRLRLFPVDLETYFQQMLGSIEECYHEQSAQIFLIAINATLPLSVVTLSMLDIRAEGFAKKAEIKPFKYDHIIALQQKTRTRLNARCKDLLEVHETGYVGGPPVILVDFLHRTAKDFLQTKETIDILRSRIPDEFDPRVFLCESLLIQIKGIGSIDGHVPGHLLRDIMYYAHEIECLNGFSVVELLDELDRVMAVHGAHSNHGWVEISVISPLRGAIVWDSLTLGCNVNFLAFAIQKHLSLYVAHKLESMSELTQRQSAANWLLHAVIYRSPFENVKETSSIDRFDMFCVLLESGLNPNDRLRGGHDTAWTIYLLHVNETEISGLEYRYRIIERFLLHGADTNAELLLQDGKKTTVSEVIHRVVSPARAEQLEKLIAQRRQSGVLQWLKWR